MANFPVIEVTEGEWTSGKFVEVLGLKFPLFFTNNNAESAQLLSDYISNFQTRPDDVFVATFPKSGEEFNRKMKNFFRNDLVSKLMKSYWFLRQGTLS